MTDPQSPGSTPPPAQGAPSVPPAAAPAPPAYVQPPPAYNPGAVPPYGVQPNSGQPYGAAPPAAYGPPAGGAVPGKTLGIVAFVLSLLFFQLIALILGIVALVQSKKAGANNGFALAAIIISSVTMVLGLIFFAAFVALVLPTLAMGAEELYSFCLANGPGVYETNGIEIDCYEILDQ